MKGIGLSPNKREDISWFARDLDEERREALMELHAALGTLQDMRKKEVFTNQNMTFFEMKPVVRHGLAIVTKEIFEQYWLQKKGEEEEEEVQQSKLAKCCEAMGSQLEHLEEMMRKQRSHIEQQKARVERLFVIANFGQG
ncbi:hypothetical protein CYMTET_12303 [Cymbomonas tetramitiformis]|uniref:Uncharacterized protein n=1 Tax=Cymbomonas tetramitiformis TaxID=36881 RepID=A0AAE0GLY9_9CHLO|nr:hypothetical protein CYMTET_12303 [Cymbomonas tetramitiformis]